MERDNAGQDSTSYRELLKAQLYPSTTTLPTFEVSSQAQVEKAVKETLQN